MKAPSVEDYSRMTASVRLQALGFLQDEADAIRAGREHMRAKAAKSREAARTATGADPSEVDRLDVIITHQEARRLVPIYRELNDDTAEVQALRRAALDVDAKAYQVGRP